MAKKKKIFEAIYAGTETRTNGSVILYSRHGAPSCIFEIENPVTQLCTDCNMYVWYFDVLRNIVETLGEGYALQKQDVFCKQHYHRN